MDQILLGMVNLFLDGIGITPQPPISPLVYFKQYESKTYVTTSSRFSEKIANLLRHSQELPVIYFT